MPPRGHRLHCRQGTLPPHAWPAVWLALALVLPASGCATQKWAELRKAPRSSLADEWQRMSDREEPSERTMLVLRRFDLVDEYQHDSLELCVKLRERFEAEPAPDTLYALAELAYLGGRKAEAKRSKKTLELYTAAMMHSYLYLFDGRFTPYQNSYDPHFRGACEVYNGALESVLRIVQKQENLLPGKTHILEAANQTIDITIACKGAGWRNEDFEGFKFVSDYQVNGLRNHYHTYGLGVPLIAVRKVEAAREGDAKYYPPGLTFPVTAFLRIGPSNSGTADHFSAVLELHDPLASSATVMGDRPVPLESDLTTPLAYFLSQPALTKLDIATIGVLKPDEVKPLQGIYMLEPYRPNRIPVLMVHGLWSSPITWMEMFNDLRGSPDLRDRYQFWFYLYPTAQPFWYTAAQLRAELANLRQNLDPKREHPALDQMVLVGHSMGGLVSRLQTLESGDAFWKTVSDEPFSAVKASDDIRIGLERTFFFRPNPSIKRVITIATPHRGSRASNNTTQYIGNKLIELPRMLVSEQQELKRDNPGLFRKHNPIDIITSIDSLSVNCAVLPVLLTAEHNPVVKFHNIVGKIPNKGIAAAIANRVQEGDSDGVVAVTSAHLDNIESEIVVSADHSKVHAHPLSVLEVRRILLEHLHTISAAPESPLERLPWTADGRPAGPPVPPVGTSSVRWASEATPSAN